MSKVILLVEDTADDAFFATRALQRAGFAGSLNRVEDGRQAVEYLSGSGAFSSRARYPMPSLILLDIKMPFLSGFDVLQWIRHESACPWVPVVMFTSSDQEADVERAYRLGANAYVVKPPHGDQFVRVAELIKGFWIETNLTAAHSNPLQSCGPPPAAPRTPAS